MEDENRKLKKLLAEMMLENAARWACRIAKLSRSVNHYKRRPDRDFAIRRELKALAARYPMQRRRLRNGEIFTTKRDLTQR